MSRAMADSIGVFLDSKVRLITKSQIRYEGIVSKMDLEQGSIVLCNVKFYGTEDRPASEFRPPKDAIFEYVKFRAADIEDIVVVNPPVASLLKPMDSAILDIGAPLPSGPSSGQAKLLDESVGQLYPDSSISEQRPRSQQHRDREQRDHRDGQPHHFQQRERRSNDYQNGGYDRPRGQGQRGGWRGQSHQGGYQARGGHGHYAEKRVAGMDQRDLESDFDFATSNRAFKDVSEKMAKVHLNEETEGTEHREEPKPYEPNNFFDNISCEAKEKTSNQRRPQGNTYQERQQRYQQNAVTFGLNPNPVNRNRTFENQSRGGGRGGHYGGQGQGGYQGGHSGGYSNNGYGGGRGGGYRDGGSGSGYRGGRGQYQSRGGQGGGYYRRDQRDQQQQQPQSRGEQPVYNISKLVKQIARASSAMGSDVVVKADGKWVRVQHASASVGSQANGSAAAKKRRQRRKGPAGPQPRAVECRQETEKKMIAAGREKSVGVQQVEVGSA